MDQQPQEPTFMQRLANFGNVLTFFAQSVALTGEVFLHDRFGDRYFRFQAIGALIFMLFYAACWQGHDLTPLAGFFIAFMAMMILARIGVLYRRVRGTGDAIHSRYTGRPHLIRIFPRLDELKTKQGIEPFLMIFIGILTCGYNEPLAVYLFITGIAMRASVDLNESYQREKALNLTDAWIEQQQIAKRFRDLRGPF